MAEKIKANCTVISGAPDDDLEFIKKNIDISSYIIAADSGYVKCKKIGIIPDLIIGDFDSSKKPNSDAPDGIIQLEVEKAFTDTFTAIRYAVENGAEDITVFGAVGSRIDHTYSNILCLDYCKKHGVKCVIVNKHNRVSLIEGEGFINKDYQWFSLFAFLEDCKGVKISGAHYSEAFYNLDKMDINLGDQFAQSNFVENNFATVTCEKGTLLLIESND